MSSKIEKDKVKQLQEKCQSVLNQLLRDEDNKYCVDCDSKGPRWASWNIGVFLCIKCAGIHRNLGVHISRVKSVNLDSWTPEQVVSLQQMGNSRARAVYEANLPDNFRRPQYDSSLETFIRAKYEHKKYIAREWVPPPLPKVNWEKEIEEEMEKSKKKTKPVVEKKPLPSVEVPQLPKPKNPSPKPNRIISNEIKTVQKQETSDLLGTQNNEDNFSVFLSATPNNINMEKKEDVHQNDIKTEEESFFNQSLPTEKEKVKLTKDSILKLYQNAPTINNYSQFQNPLAAQSSAVNYPINMAAPPQGGFQGQFNYSQQTAVYPVQNGIVPPFAGGQQFANQIGQQFPIPNLASQVPYNQMGMAYSVPQNSNFQMSVQFPIPNQFNQQPQMQYPSNFGLPQTRTQGNTTQNLQQQFSNLNLNGPQQSNGSIATNVWP